MGKNTNSKGFATVEVLIVAAVLVLLIATCGLLYLSHESSKGALKNTENTRLIIKRGNTLNQPGIGNFSKSVSHSSAVAILNDLSTLELVPDNSVYNCPNDDGVEYTFVFADPTVKASAPASGCQFVTVNDKTYQSSDKFWKDVSSATK